MGGGLTIGLVLAVLPSLQARAQTCPAGTDLTPIGLEASRLDAAKAAIEAGDVRLRPAQSALLARADVALAAPLRSVMDKPAAGDSGDKHDYVSLAPYWWPDPTTSDGRPYLRRDGEVNPARAGDRFDRSRLQDMRDDVITLSLAAVMTDDPRYAAKADAALRAWFVDAETRMNPDLSYAQQIPGRTNGRAIGIIDAHGLPAMVDAAMLLANEGMLADDTMQGLRQWFGAYAAWLISSEFGRTERAAANNHGTHYDAQLASFLVFGGRCDLAARVIADARQRSEAQIDEDGFMPEEASRTRSLHYHSFNAEAFLRLALVGRLLDVELYDHEGEDGAGSVRDTVRLLAGHAGRSAAWPYERLDDRGLKSLWHLLMRTRLYETDPIVEAGLSRMDGWETDEVVLTSYQPSVD